MPQEIPESDWKILRGLKEVALERFCQRVLGEIANVSANQDEGFHKRYLAVFNLIDQRNTELGLAFDNLRRSSGLSQLAKMRALGLVTPEEFSRFSSESQEIVEKYSF